MIDRKTAALLLIEDIAAYADTQHDKWGPGEAKCGLKAIRDIFKIAHAGRNPSCMPKHPEWEVEINAMLCPKSKETK